MYYTLHGLSPGKVRAFSINVLHACIVPATTKPVGREVQLGVKMNETSKQGFKFQ